MCTHCEIILRLSHWTKPMRIQHWFRLIVVRQQAITGANVDPDLSCSMTSLGLSELKILFHGHKMDHSWLWQGACIRLWDYTPFITNCGQACWIPPQKKLNYACLYTKPGQRHEYVTSLYAYDLYICMYNTSILLDISSHSLSDSGGGGGLLMNSGFQMDYVNSYS